MFRLLGLILLVIVALIGWSYANILVDPTVRGVRIGMTDWPKDTAPVRVALISDIHVQGPDMPPERVARIVESVNARKPDVVLLAGDFIGDRPVASRYYSQAEIAAPLSKLKAPLGVFAVLGNHDHGHGGPAMRKALESAGITVLSNTAQRAGPLTLVGIDDLVTRHANIPASVRAADALPGPTLAFTHSPDIVPKLGRKFPVVLAGHTHCGQVVLPIYGAIETASRYGDRYLCGVIREQGRAIVVTGGLGTSLLPFRFGAPPDWWLITLGPANAH
jgi:uncharacterized protein